MCGVSVSNTRKGTEVPEVVKDYNLNAHQVDNYDRLVEKFKFNHRLDKVTQVQIVHILFQILENSRVAYSNLMEFEKKIDLQKFIVSLCEEITEIPIKREVKKYISGKYVQIIGQYTPIKDSIAMIHIVEN